MKYAALIAGALFIGSSLAIWGALSATPTAEVSSDLMPGQNAPTDTTSTDNVAKIAQLRQGTTQRAPEPAPPREAATKTESVKSDEVIARVGSSDVTAEEVRTLIASLEPRQRAVLAQDPGRLSQTVRAMLANRLVLKEALGKKWDQKAEVVAQIARARENVIVESFLQSMTMPPENYPSEAEIKAVYDANASAFLVPRRFQIAQIFIAVPKDAEKAAEDAARRKIDDVVKRLKQPNTDFASLAKNESDDKASADRGGEIGWLAEAELRPEIKAQVVGLAKSATTDPIRLDDGWHIIKLLDTRAAHSRPIEEVKSVLIARIRAERADANRQAYVSELLKQTPPVINEIALSKLLAATSGAAAPGR